jgi:hypothetical protein
MFETAFQEKRVDMRWGILSACVAFIVLLVIGYMLIA